jgi:hypothetical protein
MRRMGTSMTSPQSRCDVTMHLAYVHLLIENATHQCGFPMWHMGTSAEPEKYREALKEELHSLRSYLKVNFLRILLWASNS